MKQKLPLILLGVLVVVMAGVLGWLMFQLNREKQPAISLDRVDKVKTEEPAFPYFPENSMQYLDTEKKWGTGLFQPIYKYFQNVDLNTNYLIVNYVDSGDGSVKEGKIFLGRQVPYYDETGIMISIDSASLKEVLKSGDQFGVEYLAQFPSEISLDMPYCQSETRPIECLFAAMKQESDKKRGQIFYAFSLSRKLMR